MNGKYPFWTIMLALMLSVAAWPCSRILWPSKVGVVVTRTMDLYMSDHAALIVSPRGIRHDRDDIKWKSKYASVGVQVFGTALSDGMNERGLGIHLLYLHGTEYEKADGRPALSNLMWAQFLLDNCATVDEVVAWLNKVRIVSASTGGREWPIHMAAEDRSGDSCIVEFVKGKMVVHHDRKLTVMTNEPPLNEQLPNLVRYRAFGGALPLPGDVDPKSRFVRASAYAKTLPVPATEAESIAAILGVARTIAVPRGAHDTSGGDSTDTWPTLWFSVCDLTHDVYYFSSTSSPNVFWVDFTHLSLAEGQPVLSLDPYDPTLVGEVSARLKGVH